MKKSLKPRSTTLTVIGATIAVIAFGGGSAVAGGLITSAQIKNHTIQGVDVKYSTLTGAYIKDGSLTGADIKDGSLSHNDTNVYFAQVNPDASIANSSGGVTGLQPFSTGTYQISFPRDVSHCTFTATVGEAGAGSAEGIVATATDRDNHPNAVYLNTTNLSGTATNEPFQLIVVC